MRIAARNREDMHEMTHCSAEEDACRGREASLRPKLIHGDGYTGSGTKSAKTGEMP